MSQGTTFSRAAKASTFSGLQPLQSVVTAGTLVVLKFANKKLTPAISSKGKNKKDQTQLQTTTKETNHEKPKPHLHNYG